MKLCLTLANQRINESTNQRTNQLFIKQKQSILWSFTKTLFLIMILVKVFVWQLYSMLTVLFCVLFYFLSSGFGSMDKSIAQATLTRFNWIQLAGWLTLTITTATTITTWISKFRKVFFCKLKSLCNMNECTWIWIFCWCKNLWENQ